MTQHRIMKVPSDTGWVKLENCIERDQLPPTLSVQQLSQVLRVSLKSAYRLVRKPDFTPAFRIGRSYLVSRDRLIEWMNTQDASKGGN